MAAGSRQDKEIEALYRINRFLGHIDDLDLLLRLIMEEASRTVEAEASSIALYDSRQKNLRFTVSLGEKGILVKESHLQLGQGIIGWAASNRKLLNIPDVTKEPRFNSGLDELTAFKSRSILAVPILYQQKMIGALEVINKKSAPSFSPEDEKLIEIVAGQAAIAIENAQLYRRLIRKNKSLAIKHQRLIEMQHQMLRMARISAIGDMASRMVHDLRNPLMIIRGYAELLRSASLSDEARRQHAKIITDEVDRLTGMTTEVMDFIKDKSAPVFGEIQLGVFINEIMVYLKRDFQPHHIELASALHYTGPVMMDKYRMQRALFNISFNARDAMDQGGTFMIETALVDNNWVDIQLMDTGPGIPAEIRERLGQPFTTFGKAHGTGLGIAIVKKIVQENHNGVLLIDSHPPRDGAFSTTFTIRIPLKQPECKINAAASTEIPPLDK